jgi:hypothetical protein
MRYVKKYDSFKKEDKINEEFLGALYNAAKGALKSFLGNIAAPFKTLNKLIAAIKTLIHVYKN